MSHRRERRAAEIAYLQAKGVRLVVSTMKSRHNLAHYEAAGLDWHHVPVAATETGADQLEELLAFLRRELRRGGAVAVHGNRHTDFVAALCAAYLHQTRGADLEVALAEAAGAGLRVTPEACALVGVDPAAVGNRVEAAVTR